MQKHNWLSLVVLALLFFSLIVETNAQSQTSVSDAQVTEALASVCEVQLNGEGNEKAVAAMAVLNRAGANQIPLMLKSMKDTNVISANWIRGAVQTAARSAESMPRESIVSFFNDRSENPSGRLAAFELLAAGDEAFAKETIPTLLDDPSLPLRLKAVEAIIKKATAIEADDDATKVAMLQKALPSARDVDQVQAIANMLEKAKQPVDLQKQLGLIPKWHLVASFDNKEGIGFKAVYGPETNPENIDLEASYEADGPEKATWNEHVTEEKLGEVDLNDVIGKVKGATAYASTIFDSPEAREVELRIGTPNAHKIWVNGKLVMSNEIYHNSNSIDKFITKANVNPGKNVILIKLCQNEQTEAWAQDWMFQLRVCDETGKAINSL